MKKPLYIALFLLFANVLSSTVALAQRSSPYFVFNTEKQAVATRYFRLKADSSKRMSLDEVRALPNSEFRLYTEDLTYTPGIPYWSKITLENRTGGPVEFVLFMGSNQRIDIYVVSEDGTVERSRAGYNVPFSQRSVQQGYLPKTMISFALGERKTIYTRILNTDGYPPRFGLDIQAHEFWEKDVEQKTLFQGVFTGILLILSLLGITYFLYSKEKSFLFYGFYSLINALYFINFYGYLDAYIFPNSPEASTPFWILPTLSCAFYFWFARVFLNSKFSMPTWHKVLGFAGYLALATFLGILTFLLVTDDLFMSIRMHNVSTIAFALLAIMFIFSINQFRRIEVRYFSLASVFLLITVIIASLGYMMSLDVEIPLLVQVGILFEIIIFSLGLGHKIKFSLRETNITRDSLIIQLRENEKLTKRSNQRLEEKVAERTHQLNVQKRELIEARVIAEKATKAKSDFLSVMSHEIRTPLNAIISLSQLMEMENENPETEEYIDALKFSAESLHSLINDILDYNKIEAGKLKLEEIMFSLTDLLKNIAEIFRFKTQTKGIGLQLSIGEFVPERLLGDPIRLTQILNNLLSNAIKFTDEGHVRLAVDLKGVKDDTASISFKVSDTGIGIPKDKLDEIFEDYEQASKETTRKYGGTGLGLAITKKLLDMHHAPINVTSQENQGTTFSFDIEFKLHDSFEVSEPGATYVRKRNLKEACVLIVDDNDMNRLVLKRLLAKWNGKFKEAHSGKEAYELFQSTAFDIILMDLEMPEMDGFEATQKIKSEGSKMNDCPVVAMSGRGDIEYRQKAQAVGMIDFIHKPFDPQELYKKIYQVVHEQKN